MAVIIVSGCLLGLECRYKGDGCRNAEILKLAGQHTLIGVCPEQMGGLPTPRDPAEIVSGKVLSCAGKDVTDAYQKGANTALFLAELNRADFAILKAKSPSCGKGLIYDGSFTGRKIPGNGIAAALFLAHNIPVFTEDELDILPL